MKKLIVLCSLVVLAFTTNAQYRKASFLTKHGRTYDIGATYRILNGGRTSPFGFVLSYGKENPDTRVHFWLDMELVMSNDFKYQTVSTMTSLPMQVSGRTGMSFGIKYNLAYFLTDNSNDPKLSPYIDISAGYQGRFTLDEADYTAYAYAEKYPSDARASVLYGGGGGFIYRFTPALGLRVSANYYGVSELGNHGATNLYPLLASHPAVNVALRFKILDQD